MVGESKTQSGGLRRAVVVTLIGALAVGVRMWGLAARPAPPTKAPDQRLTPIDAPRFAGGRWVDEGGKPIELPDKGVAK